MHDGSRKAILAALLANTGIAIAKLVAATVTGSASMLAESIHSAADAGNQGLLFLGGNRARRAATSQHQFGFGRERYFWAFVVALVLFSLGALFSLYEGIQKVLHPHDVDSPTVAFVVLAVAIGLESYSMNIAVKEARPHRGNGTWWHFIRHSRNPELPVVLLEDLGALVGLIFATIGLGLAVITGDPVFDAIGSISIGLLLGVIAVILAIEMKASLIGESATPADERAITAALQDGPGIRRIIHMRTLHLGPDEILVAAKIDVAAATTAEVASEIDAAEARIRAVLPTATRIYLEPDLDRTP